MVTNFRFEYKLDNFLITEANIFFSERSLSTRLTNYKTNQPTTNRLTVEHSPSSETKRTSSSHENPYILNNTKVQHRVHSNPSLAPVLNKVNQVKALHLRLDLLSGLFPLDCLNKTLYM